MLFCCLLIFFKIDFLEKFYQNYHQSVKHFVGPDLGPNCLQKLSADGTSRYMVWFFTSQSIAFVVHYQQNQGFSRLVPYKSGHEAVICWRINRDF